MSASEQPIVHTPTEWACRYVASSGYWNITDENGRVIAHVIQPWEDTGATSELARLVTAAPRLLAMVKRLQTAIGAFCCDNCITEDDLEDGGDDILYASREADELLAKIAGKVV